MKTLTKRQAAFVDNKIAGLNNRAAAIAAGYSSAGADTRGSELMRRPDIRGAIAKATKGKLASVDIPEPSRMLPKYATSLALLQHVYNCPAMPDSVRMRAAEQALPYEHGRIGEKGKKEQANDRAKELAGTKRAKFAPKEPPQRLQ